MTTASDDFQFEKSRAAVTVACLQWLGCTGPKADPGAGRFASAEAAGLLRRDNPIASPIEPPHPLWDRWLDG